MRISWLTIGLGLSMTVSYGVLYYSFGLLAPRMAEAYDADLSLVFGLFSASLLAGAAFAPISGRLIDRFGARAIMSLGTITASLALTGFWASETLWQAGLAILLAEIVAVTVQYEAAFTALAKRHGMAAGRHITGVTLIAGFASTIFWPLIEYLLTITDWRHVYLMLAILNLVVCLPIHAMIPAGSGADSPMKAAERPAQPAPLLAEGAPHWGRAMVLMGIVFTGTGVAMSAVNSSIMVLLADMGFDSQTAAWSVALIGPAQVLARLGDLTFSGRLPATGVAVISTGLMAIGLAMLALSAFHPSTLLVAAFALLYGSGQGLSSIVKGVLPLTFFGAADYGRITGKLAGYRLAFAALAPFVIIMIREQAGVLASVLALSAVMAISLASVLVLMRMDPSRRAKP